MASWVSDGCVMDAFPAAIIPFPIANNFRLEIQVVPRKLTLFQMSWEADGLDQGGDNEMGSRSSFDDWKWEIRERHEPKPPGFLVLCNLVDGGPIDWEGRVGRN